MSEHECEYTFKKGDKVVPNCTKEEFMKEVDSGKRVHTECFQKGYATVTGVVPGGGVFLEGWGCGNFTLFPYELKYIKPFVEEPKENLITKETLLLNETVSDYIKESSLTLLTTSDEDGNITHKVDHPVFGEFNIKSMEDFDKLVGAFRTLTEYETLVDS